MYSTLILLIFEKFYHSSGQIRGKLSSLFRETLFFVSLSIVHLPSFRVLCVKEPFSHFLSFFEIITYFALRGFRDILVLITLSFFVDSHIQFQVQRPLQYKIYVYPPLKISFHCFADLAMSHRKSGDNKGGDGHSSTNAKKKSNSDSIMNTNSTKKPSPHHISQDLKAGSISYNTVSNDDVVSIDFLKVRTRVSHNILFLPTTSLTCFVVIFPFNM